MNYSLDVGPNVTSLGFTFLFLKYLLPVIIVAILIAFGYYLIRHYWPKDPSPFDPVRPVNTFKKSWIVVVVAVILVLIAVMLT